MDDAELVLSLTEFASDLTYAVEEHKRTNSDWIRDGKRSVTIVEYQLNKNNLGEEARLVAAAASRIESLSTVIARVESVADRFARQGYLAEVVDEIRAALAERSQT